ncbi:bifunctional metallophosphatase/5'-nucleotidase [Haloarchaeobius amylolyticus]|uniref:bifunctional metallophosphatase/5'-nucleotidase n=1 Tax=Haloarchaeobius amylolyticus TaxID=1198296 RepID=UPI0022713A47|nr:5'-nucleotidase C-terminal domain-containing protein [Haloarchaeobius amylolyticus]
MSPRLLHYSDVENAYDDPERIGRLAGTIRERDGDDALVVGTGDNTAPGVLALVNEGRQALDFFAAIDTDLETFGNHDFDFGADATVDLVADSPQTWLTANVRQNGDRFAAAHTESWTIREVDGARIGFFGVTDPRTPSINPAATGLHFTDPIAAAEEAVADLRAEGVDHVVAVSHLGSDDEELAVSVDVDCILGGHVHSMVEERIDDTLLVRPGVNGGAIFEVELGPDGASATRHDPTEGPLDESVADALRTRMDEADLTEVVAVVEDPIPRSHAAAFRGESRIGNFVADAYRWATDADVGLQNSGGIREGDELVGEVTIGDLISVVPFKEPVTVAELTGAELLDTLRQASGANVAFGEPDWWHAHLSGAHVTWDRQTHELVRATVDGDPIDPERTYTLATTDYLFHTDHEFPALDDQHRAGTYDIQYEVLAAYARECGVDPVVEGRVVWNGDDT